MNVATAAELATAIQNAKAGDEIVLAAGMYALGDVTCSANGTAAAPIVVRSATPLVARVDFSGVEGFRVPGAHWHFEGLDVHGVCPNDVDCEHAFHVFGGATGFVLRGNRIVDFNAQLKVNAERIGVGNGVIPHDGLVEYNELFDTHARATDTPVTKLDIDTGDDWVVRGNYVHDFHGSLSTSTTPASVSPAKTSSSRSKASPVSFARPSIPAFSSSPVVDPRKQ